MNAKLTLTSWFCVYLLSASISATQAQDFSEKNWLGYTPGSYQTGTFMEMWTDEGRAEFTTSDPNDRRRMMIQIWYPASPVENSEYAPYAQDISLYKEYIQKWGASISEKPTNSVLNAPIDSSPSLHQYFQ